MDAGRFVVFSASVRGPGHERAGLPNQDACLSFSKDGRTGIVLSDGLGACARSEKGSKAVCLAVVAAMETASADFDVVRFIENVKSRYCELIDADERADSLATCLWCFCPGDGRTYAGMLGDGMIALMDRGGRIVRLTDSKADGFSNVVAALTPTTEFEQWQTLSLPECYCVMLCSDGVADDLADPDGFAREFFGEYCGRNAVDKEVADMLEKWPAPLHTDDKTIICMTRRQRWRG